MPTRPGRVALSSFREAPDQRVEDVAPPTSAGNGGGNGTAEVVGAADVCVAVGVGDAVPDVVGVAVPDVVGAALDEELDFEDPEVAVAGDCGLWKSVHDSVRRVLPAALTLSDVAVAM